MKRTITRELLDELPANEPCAARSRRDLCRLNALMRHHAILAGVLETQPNGTGATRILELGAGDGRFLLTVAQRLTSAAVSVHRGVDGPNAGPATAGPWGKVEVTLLDRQPAVARDTIASFSSLGWRAKAVSSDVLDWSRAGDRVELIIANLFLHHLPDPGLSDLLRAIAERAGLFVALEPCRGAWPLFCSRLLWVIGCNQVTRHDAIVSVQAGFSNRELSALWPDRLNWRLTERRAGPFSHLFIAQRTG